jgi:hypothetical protein
MPSLHGAPKTGMPLPLYRISAAAAASAKPLARVQKIGWQYPLLGGKCPGLVNLREGSGGLKYSGVIEGALPERFLSAALLAEREFQDDDETYEPRLLHIPSLQLQALWLYRARGRSRFVSFSERRRALPLKVEDDIRGLIRRVRAAAREEKTVTARSSPRPKRQRVRGSS